MAWATSTGLLDQYEGTIEESWFAYDPNYRDGEVPLLHWRISNVVTEEEAPDEIVEKFSIGSGWQVVDNGATVEHESGRNKPFNRNSKYGMIIQAVIDNEDGAFEGGLAALQERGDPIEANVWEGLRFEFERVEYDYGGEIGVRDFILPVAFVGEEDAPSSNGNGSSQASRESLEKKLKALAKKAADHDEFVELATDLDAVVDDDELFASVVDDSDQGFYATVA